MAHLVNIHSKGNTIYLFERIGQNLHITDDTSYKQSYYEPDEKGIHTAYDGTRLRKIEVRNPYDVKKFRSNLSYSSDIPFTKNYLIHKVDALEKCDFKYFFIDIEVYAKEVPSIPKANQPVSCISLYNSHTKDIKTFWIMDYSGTLLEQEKKLFDAFLSYVCQEKPDIMTGWNYTEFDYPYLYNRFTNLFPKRGTLATVLSPINQEHSGNSDFDTTNPAGISQMDYLGMFKKVFMREPVYTLDAIAQKYVGDQAWGTSNFGELTEDIRDKNINDIVRLVKLEEKFNLFNYFDEIRRLTKTEWEDLLHNSFIVENLLMQKAKQLNIVLPNRPKRKDDEEDEPTFLGAAREAVKTGALFDIGKFDLGSAYPNMMVNFCLDSSNVTTDDSGLVINGTCFQQDHTALIPSMIKDILQLKDNLKDQVKKATPKTPEHTALKIKYDAIKGVVNSGFGAIGFSSFRLYDERVASAITYLVRDVLEYTREQVRKMGHEVIYYDTDSVFTTCKDDISKELNQFIQDWAKLKGKKSINLSYEYEGYFERIFVIALCRYIGYLKTNRGIVKEIKGAEAKRADSTAFQKTFQPELVDKILNKESKEDVTKWILKEKDKIRTCPIEYISMPCKLPSKEYNKVSKTGKKLLPIFVRAINNTNSVKKLECPVGEMLWWNYVVPKQQDANGKDMDVFAFTKEDKSVISKYRLDWDRIIDRNIITKATAIFEANHWSSFEFTSAEQTQLL